MPFPGLRCLRPDERSRADVEPQRNSLRRLGHLGRQPRASRRESEGSRLRSAAPARSVFREVSTEVSNNVFAWTTKKRFTTYQCTAKNFRPSIYDPDFIAANQAERADNVINAKTKSEKIDQIRLERGFYLQNILQSQKGFV